MLHSTPHPTMAGALTWNHTTETSDQRRQRSWKGNCFSALPYQVEDGMSNAINGRIMTKEPLVVLEMAELPISAVSVVLALYVSGRSQMWCGLDASESFLKQTQFSMVSGAVAQSWLD